MMQTDIDNISIDRILQRGTGEILAQDGQVLFVRDRLSGSFFLNCEDVPLGIGLLDRHLPPGCHLLVVSDRALGKAAFERYGFARLLECHQVAYFGSMPELSTDIALRDAELRDLPLITAVYEYETPESLRQIVERKKLLLAFDQGQLAGFMGEHPEGSMGLLYIFPEYRRKGYAEALERALIAKTMAEGFIPFGQVVKDNTASLALQEKLGMTISENLSYWMSR